MKKILSAKNLKRCVAAATVVVAMIALIAPYAGAASPYVNKVAQVNEYAGTSISGLPHVNADNLMIYLLNRMYPIGSVYMWVPNTPTDNPYLSGQVAVQNHFGGTWAPFAQGRVLLGAVSTATPGTAYAIGTLGGGMGGTSVVPVNASINLELSSIQISPQTSTVSGGGISGYVAPTLIFNATTQYPSGSKNITSSNFIPHYHTAATPTAASFSGGTHSSSNGSPQESWPNSTGSYSTSVSWGTSTQALVSTYFTFSIPSRNMFSSPLAAPTYTNPTMTHTAQQLTTKALTLNATQNVNVSDTTVQPYQTCYMFVRTGLAPYN